MSTIKKVFIICIILAFFCTAIVHGEDAVTVQGEYYKAKCTCQCNGKELEASSILKKELLTKPEEALTRCQEQCSRSCGGFTTCVEKDDKSCSACCTTFCSSKFVPNVPGNVKTPGDISTYKAGIAKSCQQACSSTCSYKGMVRGITEIIYEVAGIIGALMIIVHAIRMITAEDASDRNSAKNSILYVLVALAVIVLAGVVVDLFMNSVVVPKT